MPTQHRHRHGHDSRRAAGRSQVIDIDSSAMAETLLSGVSADSILDLMTEEIAPPYLLDTEILSVLRGLLLGHRIDEEQAEEDITNFYGFVNDSVHLGGRNSEITAPKLLGITSYGVL